jgi:hypothetical protein
MLSRKAARGSRASGGGRAPIRVLAVARLEGQASGFRPDVGEGVRASVAPDRSCEEPVAWIEAARHSAWPTKLRSPAPAPSPRRVTCTARK